MVSFKVLWKHSAERELRNIDRKHISRIIKTIEGLTVNPFPPGYRKLQTAEKFYRIRIGNYRVIYMVDIESKEVIIFYIRHRKEAYRKF